MRLIDIGLSTIYIYIHKYWNARKIAYHTEGGETCFLICNYPHARDHSTRAFGVYFTEECKMRRSETLHPFRHDFQLFVFTCQISYGDWYMHAFILKTVTCEPVTDINVRGGAAIRHPGFINSLAAYFLTPWGHRPNTHVRQIPMYITQSTWLHVAIVFCGCGTVAISPRAHPGGSFTNMDHFNPSTDK